MTYKDEKLGCAHRFRVATYKAEAVVAGVEAERLEHRLRLYDEGMTPLQVDVARFVVLRELRSIIDQFHPAPFAHGDPFTDEYREKVVAARGPLLRAVVWELWRDYDEWPSYEDVVGRMVTWTGLGFHEVSPHVCAVEHVGIDGLKCEPPIHDGKRHRANLKTWRWYLTDEVAMRFEEQMFQWRTLLADEGFVKRTVLTLFADAHPGHWTRLPV